MGKMHSSKTRKIFFIISISIFVIAMGGGGYYYATRNTSKQFLQTLKTAEVSTDTLKGNWALLASKAQTPLHFLILLKRLDVAQLKDEYRKTLVRALWKYPRMQSFLILALEYTITAYKNSLVVEKNLFKEYIEENIGILWGRYPNLVRLYYILRTKNNKEVLIDNVFITDDILRVYKKINNTTVRSKDYLMLWNTMGNQLFLYAAAVYAQKEGDLKSAKQLYTQVDKRFLTQNIKLRNAALFFRDTANLKQISEYTNSLQAALDLASVHTVLYQYKQGYRVLQEYNNTHKNQKIFPIEWYLLYLWLAIQKAKLYSRYECL